MLWRSHAFRTLQSKVSLKKEPTCDKFTVTKRSFHYQSYNFKRPDTGKALNLVTKRFASTESTGINFISKTVAKFSPENISKLTGLPTIEAATKYLSLDHCLPVEAFQNGFLYLHSSIGLPWWSVIAISALSTRLLLLPLAIFAERNYAQISNHIPRVQLLQKQLAEANKSMDSVKSSRLAREISLFKNHKQITWSIFNTSIITLVQAPLFILFLTAVRNMPNAQLQSMRHGGLFWFSDLTATDPKFILPILTSITLYAIVELTLNNAKYVKDNKALSCVLRAHPFIILPFVANFSTAFLFYWTCFNFLTIVEASIFRIPAVRDFFRIEKNFSLLPNALKATSPIILKRPKITKNFYEEFQLKERLHKMRYSKARRGPSNKPSTEVEMGNVQQIPQRLKLKAIMDSTRSKF